MCGICGYINLSGTETNDELAARVGLMAGSIAHRGPDDAGVWVDAGAGIALGHRRLSILDLSPGGHQPMASASGRFLISYNGEVYNFKEIRRELEENGARFHTSTDTEIILSAIENWGLPQSAKRFVGMFAFALWDRKERMLHLVRDRVGEKPLYYGWSGGCFLFASELKALKAHQSWKYEINRDAIAQFMRYSYIHVPHTIYRNVYKLQPGTILSRRLDDLRREGLSTDHAPLASSPYWSFKKVFEDGTSSQYEGSENEAVERTEEILKNAVGLQMVADVSVGAFLSGGVDSSLLVSLMQSQSSKPVKTFTIGFNEAFYNEAENAKAVASHLGTDHTELYVGPSMAMEMIKRLPAVYDEPFADCSQIPVLLLAELTKQYVTVSLSGDGGDEIFAGYNRYFFGRKIYRRYGRLPTSAKKLLIGLMRILSPTEWDALFRRVYGILPRNLRQRMPGDRIYKLAEALEADTPEGMYLNLVSHWKSPTSIVLNSTEPPDVISQRHLWPGLHEFVEVMNYIDCLSYLPDDILLKIDRAGMAVSLETRMPYLDHRLIEFAGRVPISMKFKDGKGKWLLRQILYKYVPEEFFEKNKMGFGLPIDAWLRGPLRSWAESLLDEKRLASEGFLHPAAVVSRWNDHLKGKANYQYLLWNILMFQAWLEVNR